MDRRRQERYCIDAPVKIIKEEDLTATIFDASCKDISCTGVLVNTRNVVLQQNQKVHLELTLTIDKLKELFGGSNRVTLKLDGVVVRTHDSGTVIEFEDNCSIITVGNVNGTIPVGFMTPLADDGKDGCRL